MAIRVKEIYDAINDIAPFCYQESWDNSGLQIGDFNNEVKGILIALDITDVAVKEAVNFKANLIISHHPLFFKPLRYINRSDKILERIIVNNINIISTHTPLDVVPEGVSFAFAELLSLENKKFLSPLMDTKFYKVSFFVPKEVENKILEVIFQKGIGEFNRYKNCAFTTKGFGHFQPKSGAKPYIKQGKSFEENKLEFIVRKDKLQKVIDDIKNHHPYDEVAIDVYEEVINPVELGYGVVGDLKKTKKLHHLLEDVKNILGIDKIRFCGDLNAKVKKVAFCGGSGASFIGDAIKNGAHVYLTGDIKYHDMLENYSNIILCDVGHRASELPVLKILKDNLEKAFDGIAIATHIENNNFYKYF